MRKAGYPAFKRGEQFNLELSATLSGGEAQSAAPVARKVAHFAFLDTNSTRAMILSESAVTLETTEYDVFETFLPELRRGLTILSEAVGGLSYMERIGLRYLNAVVPKQDEKLEQYLVPEIHGLSARMSNSFRYSFAESALITDEGHQVICRAVSQNAPLGFPADLQLVPLKIGRKFSGISGAHATIDIDGSTSQRRPFSIQDAEDQLTKLHDLNHQVFQASVTDYSRTQWGYKA